MFGIVGVLKPKEGAVDRLPETEVTTLDVEFG